MSNAVNDNIMDRLYDEITSSCLHAAFIKNDKNSNIIRCLSDKLVYPEQFSAHCYGNTKCFVGTILHVGYSEGDVVRPDLDQRIKNRADAIYQLFDRWTGAGFNTRHASDPFKSKAFMKYLDSIDYITSDYVVLATEW